MQLQLPDIKNFIRTLTFKKVINYLKLIISYKLSIGFKKYIFWGHPAVLMLEPTTACNLGCSECVAGLKNFKRPTGSMNLENFKKYIDDLSDNIMYLMLYFQGEPMLNPHLHKMIHYARKKNIYSTVSTNGHFLTPENSEKIIHSGLNRILISMDGVSQENYIKYRKEGNLGTVTSGINNLLEAKKKVKSSTPYILIQFIVFKHNESEIPYLNTFIKQWRGDVSLQLKSAQVYDYKNGNSLIPENAEFRRYIPGINGKWNLRSNNPDAGCWKMWHTMVLTWDGRAVSCCFDKNAEYQLSQVNGSSLKNVWNFASYIDLRKKLINRRDAMPICENCTEGLKVGF